MVPIANPRIGNTVLNEHCALLPKQTDPYSDGYLTILSVCPTIIESAVKSFKRVRKY